MSEIPDNLRYSSDHEWVLLEDEGTILLGITDHAQELLGEIVYADLPEPGTAFAAGDVCAAVESVKAVGDIYLPVSGEITATNAALVESPELVNSDPYGDGWILRVEPSDATQLDELMDAAAYEQFLAEQAD